MSKPLVRRECLKWNIVNRITHWLLVISIGILIFSGLPVFDYNHFSWLVWVFGGKDMRALVHRGAGVVLAIAVAIHVVYGAYRILKAIFNHEKIEVMFTLKDLKDFMKIIKHWFGLSKEYPELGFHHPGEKGVYFAVALGIILTGPTGILLWFRWIAPEYLNLLTFLHELGFMIISIVITGHFILAITPTNWPILKAMFTDGKVSEKWARHHLRWWKEACLQKRDEEHGQPP